MSKVAENYFVADDGLRLFYRDFAGPSRDQPAPVLCLHGLSRNGSDFLTLASHLACSRRVIVPDFRGRGRSDHDPEPLNYYPEQYVRDTWGLLDSLKLDKLVVIGTSLGGWMAMIMAHVRRSAIEAVVLNDIGPELAPEGTQRLLDSLGTLPETSSLQQAADTMRAQWQAIFPDWSAAQWLLYARNTYREAAPGKFVPMADAQIAATVRAGTARLRHDPWQIFAALQTIPTLLLRGEHSDILSPETVTKMQARKPDLRAVTVPYRGHAPYLDEPEAIHAIDQIISQH